MIELMPWILMGGHAALTAFFCSRGNSGWAAFNAAFIVLNANTIASAS